mgnify:CR=1 FL=1|jgi:hypothetical protein
MDKALKVIAKKKDEFDEEFEVTLANLSGNMSFLAS